MMNTHAIKIPPKRHSVLRIIDLIPSSIWNIMPRWMCRWYDRLADRVWRRFHVLKLSYGYGWSDVSNKILYANFDLLTEFVRKENSGEVIDWSSSQEDAAAWIEISALYEWWRITRPTRKDPLDQVVIPKRRPMEVAERDKNGKPLSYQLGDFDDEPKIIGSWNTACQESWRLEEEWKQEDDEMLHRLIKIRHFLWT